MGTSAKENGSNVAHERLYSPNITITEPGFVYIYISNEEATPIDVFFDDLKVTQNMSDIVAGADYYPFGLPIPERELTREPYRYGYQGQYAEKDRETGFNFFDLRMYDARIGRTLSPDPYGQFASPYLWVSNNPTTNTDPTGGVCCGSLFTALQNLQETFGTILSEVTVTASRLPAAATGLNVIARSGYALEFGNNIKAPMGDLGGNFGPVQVPELTNPAREYRSPATAGIPSPEASISSYLPSAATIENIAGYASLIPGVQTVAGVIEAGAALAQGRYLAAGIAVAGAVPILGYAAKAWKLSKNARKAVVIGEGMTRVRDIGRQIGAKWYQAWGKNFPINNADELERALQRNKRWIETKIKKGYTIYDAGPVHGNSPFYKLEKEMLKIHKYPTVKL